MSSYTPGPWHVMEKGFYTIESKNRASCGVSDEPLQYEQPQPLDFPPEALHVMEACSAPDSQ